MVTGFLMAAAINAGVCAAIEPVKRDEPVPAAWRAEIPSAAAASNGFGLDLYRALAKDAEGKDLFLSPYSMSVALAMAAEGARGETETEMAAVLRFPPGIDGGRGVTRVHGGYAALAEHFRVAAGVADAQTRDKIKDLRAKLEAANKEVDRLQDTQKWQESHEAQRKAEGFAQTLNKLLTEVDRFDLRVANALWVEKTFGILPTYVEVIARYYGTGGVNAVDFARDPDQERVKINDWVASHTENRIQDLIPKGAISDLTRLVITNAVYFRGEWAAPFKEDQTKEEDFTRADGGIVKVKMMNDPWRAGVPYAAFNADGTFFQTPMRVPADEEARSKVATYPDGAGSFTMIELPYKGDTLSMLVIAPRAAADLAAVEDRLTAKNLDLWTKKLGKRSVVTAMPRFKMDWSGEMSDVLQSLGLRRAFVNPGKKDGADFSGISEGTDPTHKVYIGGVLHKSWVEVTEKGTEAAAATAVVMVTSAARQAEQTVPFTPVFRADRPFIFIVRDVQSGVILFIGRKTQ